MFKINVVWKTEIAKCLLQQSALMKPILPVVLKAANVCF